MLIEIKNKENLKGMKYVLLTKIDKEYLEVLLSLLDANIYFENDKSICIFHKLSKDLSEIIKSFKQNFLLNKFKIYTGKYFDYDLFLFSYKKFNNMLNTEKKYYIDESLGYLIHEKDKTFKRNTLRGLYLNEEFEKIISVVCKCNLNNKKASEILGIHRNTLNNKIKHLKNITGYDLNDFEDSMVLYIVTR